MGEPNADRRRLRFFQGLSAGLALGLSACLYLLTADWVRENIPESRLSEIEEGAPHQEEVRGLIEPLRYSGIQAILRPDFRITFDFAGQKWRLRNVHSFDEAGSVLLDKGRYGLCGDLAAYTYQKVRPLLGPGYTVEFVNVAESEYFPFPLAQHYILKIMETGTGKLFYLDPAFRRYGGPEMFDEYLFVETTPMLDFVARRRNDEVFDVNTRIPLVIRRKFLIGLEVTRSEGEFNPENLTLALSGSLRHTYLHRKILAFRKKRGELDVTENVGLAHSLLKPEEYRQIREKLLQTLQELPREDLP